MYSRIRNLFQKMVLLVGTLWRLGLHNIARVARYRIGLKRNWYDMQPPQRLRPASPFFTNTTSNTASHASLSQALFNWKKKSFSTPPKWHDSQFDTELSGNVDLRWDHALAALPTGADVKEIWEMSRFYWVPELALAARDGDTQAADILNTWLSDWMDKNPAYSGVNWACGQEAALRILHLAQAAVILDEVVTAHPALLHLIETCATRIAPTLHYALGQSNNHASAEAAGLFVAGTWLARVSDLAAAPKWAKRGRFWLENRARVLILPDGSSNQYSTNYHRVVLDTYAFAEVWRRHLNLPGFSGHLTARMTAATRWLYNMTDPETGDVPNFGANDGSLLLSATRHSYRDYRPTVQLCAAVFSDALAYPQALPEDRVAMYNLANPTTRLPEQTSHTFYDGGYHILRHRALAVFMRIPVFKYRPGHADALHLDIHKNGTPVALDAGTYSYSCLTPEALFKTRAHNTIEFDNRDQMPKFGQFLYGAWLNAKGVRRMDDGKGIQTCTARYTDSQNASHRREAVLSDTTLTVIDQIEGFQDKAVLRWHLAPGEYHLQNTTLQGNGIRLEIETDLPLQRCEITQGWHSGHYLKKQMVPVLEVETCHSGRLTSRFHL